MTPPHRAIVPAVVTLLLYASPTQAQRSADEILARMDSLQRIQQSESSRVEMILYDEGREVRRRELTVLSRTDDNDRTSAFVEFRSPADIRGLRLLTIETDDGDDQRVYLPALRRVQRIAGASRQDRFAGSDLSYEDLRVRDREDYTSRIVDSTDAVWRIESVPKDRDSPYTRIVSEIDKDMYAIVGARYFDRKGRPAKILAAGDFRQHEDGVWRPSRIAMEDVREDRRTELIYLERDFDTEISPDVFSDRYLRRGVQ